MPATRASLAAVLLVTALSGCDGDRRCNGQEALCSRAYTDVTFPGTHNAYSTTAEGFGAANQSLTISQQLALGVRTLHLEAQHWDDGPYLCHSLCTIGHKRLADGLAEVGVFLKAHGREVVTLLVETSNLPPAEVKAAFDEADVTRYAHPHALGTPWPTLGELIAKGERLVVLVDHDEGYATYPWWLPRWKFTFQTPWNNQSPEDYLRCFADRGDDKNPLYTVDVYQEDLILPKPEHDALVNRNPFLINRVRHCQMTMMRRPNFVLVNYVEVSDLIAAVDTMNGFGTVATDWDAFPPLDGGTRD
mgnify:CR=1 FL=1